MIYFLTSATTIGRTPVLNPSNGFVSELTCALNHPVSGLFICSDPSDHEYTDRFADAVLCSFKAAGIVFSHFCILDGRNEQDAAGLVGKAGLIILAGGHVPTQNSFFSNIGLRKLLKSYTGVLVGISAGTMNCAEVVYAQPELAGEAVSPEFVKFLPGLGITKAMVIPHYQLIKDDILDGLRVFEDVTYPDSLGHRFYALVDGSYILGKDGKEELHGEAYLISDGKIEKISKEGQIIRDFLI